MSVAVLEPAWTRTSPNPINFTSVHIDHTGSHPLEPRVRCLPASPTGLPGPRRARGRVREERKALDLARVRADGELDPPARRAGLVELERGRVPAEAMRQDRSEGDVEHVPGKVLEADVRSPHGLVRAI